MKQKTYATEEIEITWKPEVCIHSENCWRGLISVFNPQKRPWIDPNGASAAEIAAQIDKCPSGALTYIMNTNESNPNPSTDYPTIEPAPNGPLFVKGPVNIKKGEEIEVIDKPMVALCRCGHSANKPFCDGAHRAANFEG